MMNRVQNYNPDVLLTLANLSNDEVFTSPDLANKLLDLLPVSLWSDKDATFLDPVSKTGVFLREITRRLIKGLEKEIPDLQERINHILLNQVFGIAITELTSIVSRRTLYCSKKADSKYSITTAFDRNYGNIYFPKVEHTWKNGKCIYCGASQEQYKRAKELDTHAYAFIHKKIPKEFKDMKFDVIVGNPPYQLNDGGGTGSSAIPIYQRFVQQAKKLNPRYLTMITPSRWFTGGRGLDEFRNEMLKDQRIRVIHDFLDASMCFPGVEIKGGVNYFLWDRDNKGHCKIITHYSDSTIYESNRLLVEHEYDLFIRNSKLISVLRKIQSKKEKSFSKIVSANDPFGFDERVEGSYKRIKPDYKLIPFDKSVEFFYNGWRKDGVGYIEKHAIRKGNDLIDKYKVLIPKAWGVGDLSRDLLTPFIAKPNSCSTETYLIAGVFDNIEEAQNLISYINTKFFHAVVSMVKLTQNAMKKVYSFVPLQDFNQSWDDKKLYEKYGLSEEEISYIEKNTRTSNDLLHDDINGDEDV